MGTHKRPRLIVSDLDGTFLSPDGTISEINAAAVVEAEAAGIPVVFATGRPTRWLDVVRELPGCHPTVVASNGAVLYDLGRQVVLEAEYIDPEIAGHMIKRLRDEVPDASFAVETGLRFGYEPAYGSWPTAHLEDKILYQGTAEELIRDEPFVKLLVKHHRLTADVLAEVVAVAAQQTLTVTHSAASDQGLAEVSALGVSKASMLARFARSLGIEAADVAAFGDMPNDVEMLSWAGMPHVVANAHPSLLDLAVTVVPANAESGVGRTIQRFLSASGAGE